jgi:flagellar basal body-associated protein FliL
MKHDDNLAIAGADHEKTLKTVAILVGVCVLFVGALSLIAVLVTSKAVGSGTAESAKTEANATKKPLSI